jgi:hypothetical protein
MEPTNFGTPEEIDRQIEESGALLAALTKAAEPAKHETVEAGQQPLLPLKVPRSPGIEVGPAANALDTTS